MSESDDLESLKLPQSHVSRGEAALSSGSGNPASRRAGGPKDVRVASLDLALARAPADLLDELRSAWGLPHAEPIRVIGRVRVKALTDGRELWFLDDIEHPVSGVGLLYPTFLGASDREEPERSAFIPQG